MTQPQYQIVLISPERFIYTEAFREIIEMLQADFAALGLEAPIARNYVAPGKDVVSILFGAHLMTPDMLDRLPSQTIIYNAEHLVPGNSRVPDHYYALLAKYEVWDFCAANLATIRDRLGNPRAILMPMGYNPVLTRVLPNHEDIDILFYGMISERRHQVLDALRQAGAHVLGLNGIYGAQRDEFIARAKVVLNMHYEEGAGFEAVRVIPLLANRKAVVCEAAGEDIPAPLAAAMRVVPYEQLAAACLDLLARDDEREQLATAGFHSLTRAWPSSLQHLSRRLGRDVPPGLDTANDGLPHVLIAGSGKRNGAVCVNADINPQRSPDWCVDFGVTLPFGTMADFGRFGSRQLRNGMFDAIIAHHLLEHIPQLTVAMRNFLDLLRPGGALHIEVPHDLSYGAWQDPTHVRAFNERSWNYYTDMHAYLDWSDARFDMVNLTFMLSPLGQQMQSQGNGEELILRTPRAVDHMRVILVKREIPATHPSANRPSAT